MDEPTKAQIKELWEWCGVKEIKSGYRGDPLGISTITVPKALPPIDLNNLFKYAVPFLLEEHTLIETYSYKQRSGLYYSETCVWDRGKTDHDIEVLKGKLVSKAFAQDFNLEKANALALFWALYKSIGQVQST